MDSSGDNSFRSILEIFRRALMLGIPDAATCNGCLKVDTWLSQRTRLWLVIRYGTFGDHDLVGRNGILSFGGVYAPQKQLICND